VLGRRGRQAGRRHRHHAAHLLLVATQRAADRDPVDLGARNALRRLVPKVLVDPTLDDAEHGLIGRPIPLVPREAAVQPPVRPLHRAGRVVAVGVIGRALVEGEGDVGAERRLRRH
jgi:hypothetical protein